jgi:two-component system, chemotaxis family, protein-glutamate methylesterase/glutaminase
MNEQNRRSVGVLVADDAAVIRKAVLSFLESVPNIKVLGVAENFAQTLDMAVALKPDVVVLDLHMPDSCAFAPAFVKSKLQLCGSQVLAISFSSGENDDEEARALAERFGAVAYLDKARFSDELIPAILQFGGLACKPV